MLNGLDLFSGIGGIALALASYVRPVAYCEIDRYAQAVLLSQMVEGVLPVAPIWDDVRTLNREILTGHAKGEHDDGKTIDIITGGFPCQDISIAGKGAGLAGERSGLFWEVVRLTGDLRPAFVFLENVPAITSRGGAEVVGAFTALGYDCRWCVVSAAKVGANHKRERWFLLAHTTGERRVTWGAKPKGLKREASASVCSSSMAHTNSLRELQQGWGLEKFRGRPGNSSKDLAHPGGKRPPKRQGSKTEWAHATVMRADWWSTEPDVGRVAHGIPHRVDRIRALGNAVVPLQARTAFEILLRGGTTP